MTTSARISLRDLCVERVAFFHILAAITADRQGLECDYEWVGSVRNGLYWCCDGIETWAAAWDESTLAALAQGLEGPVDGAEVFRGAPPQVEPLADELREWFDAKYPKYLGVPSSSFWVAFDGVSESVGFDRHRFRFAVLTTERREAFLGLHTDVRLQEFFGLEEDALWVAERLSTLLMSATRVTLTKAEHDELLTAPRADPRYARARQLLEQMGFAFPT